MSERSAAAMPMHLPLSRSLFEKSPLILASISLADANLATMNEDANGWLHATDGRRPTETDD